MTIALGLLGVGGLVFGSVKLFKATRMSLYNIRAEAALIRWQHPLDEQRPTGVFTRLDSIS